METHAHHLHKAPGKNFWHYFYEFLMLFLAVFCGFLAENFREHGVESKREKQFAKELYSEFLDDSVAAANKIRIRLEKERDMDWLANYFKDSSLTSLPRNFYPAYTTVMYLANTYAFEPKDGVLTQLRNSGSLRYFNSVTLQKLFGDISVSINNVRYRNDQEYQFFASPIKDFILKHFDFAWTNELRNRDADSSAAMLDIVTRYRQGSHVIEGKILNLSSFDRSEATNMISFYKQMFVSTRTLQYNNYIVINHEILDEIRHSYKIE
jgi:hypothetical protein